METCSYLVLDGGGLLEVFEHIGEGKTIFLE